MIRGLVLFALVWACSTGLCHGHGIVAAPARGGVGVRVTYDDGTPVTFSDARVFAPGADEKPTLTGTTDRNGCFMFRPDTNGVWKVTVDDGMGHAITHVIEFDGQSAAPARSAGGMSKRHGVVTGLAALFGVFGWTAFLRLKLVERG